MCELPVTVSHTTHLSSIDDVRFLYFYFLSPHNACTGSQKETGRRPQHVPQPVDEHVSPRLVAHGQASDDEGDDGTDGAHDGAERQVCAGADGGHRVGQAAAEGRERAHIVEQQGELHERMRRATQPELRPVVEGREPARRYAGVG